MAGAGHRDALKLLPKALEQGNTLLVRGTEREIITPDANTGGYYSYTQDRAVAVFQGPTGPVLVSVGCQTKPSDIGRKGYVVGEDADWNYLYSEETGLTKTGLGWVDSYMYNAHSIIVFVADSSSGTIRAGSFKWLNAGWAKVNMVKQSHIINGIKRFTADFKAVLESSRLPETQELAAIYEELKSGSTETLRQMVAPYLEAIGESGTPGLAIQEFARLRRVSAEHEPAGNGQGPAERIPETAPRPGKSDPGRPERTAVDASSVRRPAVWWSAS
jgi:hypothetical protein